MLTGRRFTLRGPQFADPCSSTLYKLKLKIIKDSFKKLYIKQISIIREILVEANKKQVSFLFYFLREKIFLPVFSFI